MDGPQQNIIARDEIGHQIEEPGAEHIAARAVALGEDRDAAAYGDGRHKVQPQGKRRRDKNPDQRLFLFLAHKNLRLFVRLCFRT